MGITTASWRTSVAHARVAEIAELYVAPGGPAPRRRERAREGVAAWAASQGCTALVVAVEPRRRAQPRPDRVLHPPRLWRRVPQSSGSQATRRRARRPPRPADGGHVTRPRAPREEGFSKDADKLIRRLSLVAFLLSRAGRPADAAEIRQRVEGYALMTDDAFKRRFYEDRAELAALGIGIVERRRRRGRRRGLLAAGLRLLPAGHRVHTRRALGAGRLPVRARASLRLQRAAAAGPAQPDPRPSRAALPRRRPRR